MTCWAAPFTSINSSAKLRSCSRCRWAAGIMNAQRQTIVVGWWMRTSSRVDFVISILVCIRIRVVTWHSFSPLLSSGEWRRMQFQSWCHIPLHRQLLHYHHQHILTFLIRPEADISPELPNLAARVARPLE